MSDSTSTSFSDSEKVELLMKKALNVPCTSSALEFFQEPAITSRNYVYQEDIVSYTIPSTVPGDLKNLGDTDVDDNGRPLVGSYTGKTSSIDSNIRYYHKIPLEVIPGTSGKAYQTKDCDIFSHPGGYGDPSASDSNDYGYQNSTAYGRVMQSSIPFNYANDGTYAVKLYKNNNGKPGDFIPFGAGGALVDARPGIVTFFSLGSITGVSESNPPHISFFRYIGSTGGVTNSQVNDMVTASTNDFTVKQIFSGGDGSASDQLTAIQLDNRDLSALSVGEMFDSLQFGNNSDGSWRITVQKTSFGSQFSVQARENGVWITKTSFTSP